MPRGWLLGLALLGLAGCEGRVTVELGRGGTVDVERLTPRLTGVELQQEGGTTLTLAGADLRDLDLLTLTPGERRVLVREARVGVSRLVGVRPRLEATGGRLRYTDGATERTLSPVVPGFTLLDRRLRENDELTLRLTLEPHFSVPRPDPQVTGNVRLRPLLRAVFDDQAGALTGLVAGPLVEGPECRNGSSPEAVRGAMVYLYPEGLAVFSDYAEGSPGNPLAAAALVAEGADYRFRFADLPRGGYVLGLVCQADRDQPQTADGLAVERLLAVQVSEDSAEVRLD